MASHLDAIMGKLNRAIANKKPLVLTTDDAELIRHELLKFEKNKAWMKEFAADLKATAA
jgi:hypothetical protein